MKFSTKGWPREIITAQRLHPSVHWLLLASVALTGWFIYLAPSTSWAQQSARIAGVEVSVSSATGATVTVSLAGTDSSENTVYLRHRLDSGPEWSAAASKSSTNATLEFTLTGLEPNADYELQAALNSGFSSPVEAQFPVRPAGRDIEGLRANGNSRPKGIWSDNTTLWVVDNNRNSSKVFAYRLADGTADGNKDLDLDSSNRAPRGIYASSDTMWVSDLWSNGKVFAYGMNSGVPTGNTMTSKEFDIRSKDVPGGLWGDGTKVLSLDHTYEQILGRNISSNGTFGADISSVKFDLDTDMALPRGIWSDGKTIWVVYVHGRVHAYSIEAGTLGQRQRLRDIELVSDNRKPWGIWSDGSIVWVSDEDKKKLFAYYLPPAPSGDGAAFTKDVALKNATLTTVDVEVAVDDPLSAEKTVYLQYRSAPSGTWQAAQSRATTGGTATFSLVGLSERTAHEARISLDSPFGVGTRVVSFSTLSKTDLARRTMKRGLVLANGDKHPWVREAYYGMRRYGANVTVSSRVSYAGATYFGCTNDWCSIGGIDIHQGYMNGIPIYAHELAHAYNIGTVYSSQSAEIVGMGWLYFAWKAKWRHDNGEYYVGNLAGPIIGKTDRHAQNCSAITSGSTGINGSVHSIICRRILPWFDLTYSARNLPYSTSDDPKYEKDYDLEEVWADIKRIKHSKGIDFSRWRKSFGGYCDNSKALRSIASSSSTLRNPWRAGGCVPQAPPLKGSTADNGNVTLSWSAPPYDGGSPVTGYRVEWRDSTEEYVDARSRDISASAARSLVVSGLEQGWVARIAAKNENGQGEFTVLDSAADATLYSLTISPGTLEPGFTRDVTSYSVSVKNSTERTTLQAVSSGTTTATILNGNGDALADADESADGHQVDLSVEDNVVEVRVTSVNGEQTGTYTVTISRVGTDTSLTPSAIATASIKNPSEAVYRVSFKGLWDRGVTSDGIPRGARFSNLVGGVHNGSATFVRSGERASQGVETLAEDGDSYTFRSEITAEGRNKDSVFQSSFSGHINPLATGNLEMVTLSTYHPRITLLTKIVPSPDWFTGVSGLSLLNEQGQWRQSHVVDLFPWDAGTEEGSGFSESNASTQPANTIKSIRGTGEFTTKPIARLTFTLQQVTDLPSNRTPYFIEGDGATRLIAENQPAGTQVNVPVSATDPDTESLTYSLGGPDASHFSISSGSGQISTNASLDYEAKSGYTVTVSVRDGQDDDGNPDSATDDTVRVSIVVTNEDDEGGVTISSNQPVIGNTLRAKLHDPDGFVVIYYWNWSTSVDKRRWIDTGSGWGDSYTPDADDAGRYLQATVRYNDGHGKGKRAIAVTSTKVQAVGATPEPPVFPTDGDYAHTIRENLRAGSKVGTPVRANDPNNDRLTYSIPASSDFEIVESTGQLRTKVELDHEGREQHIVTVTATDPGGLTDTVSVTITVEDVDETPIVSGPTSLEVAENGNRRVADYTATDPDEKGIEWILTGSDSEDFTLSGGAMTLNEAADFEEKNRYRVTVEAREQGDGASVGRLNVTIHVTNVYEPGTVAANVEEPRVGQRVRLGVKDEDGGVIVTEWEWERGASSGFCGTVNSPTVTTWETINGARSSSYTPTAADQGHCIRATAFYNDRSGTGRTAQFLTARSVEIGPFFTQDPPTYRVQENMDEGRDIGRLQAQHSTSGEALTYRLGGGGAGYFTIDNEGQLKTSAAPLDFETRPGKETVVEVTAEDTNGRTATITATITVTDDDTKATGAPAITGIAEVGEELTANTSGVTDGDGLNNVSYEFQWVRVASGGLETDISGATSDAYTVQAADVGDAFKLRVAFTDDKDNPESLTSAPTAVVTVAQVKVSFGAAAYGAAEGGTAATVQVSLDKDPHRTVTIPLTATPGGGAVPADYAAPTQVVFNAGETSKDVTVTAVDDNVDDDGESVDLTFGVLPASVSQGATTRAVVQITDNDGKGIVLSPTSLSVTEGGSATYTVALASQPAADVAVTIAGHSGTDLRLNRTSLTFTTSDWNREQSVMASAVEDSDSNNDSATLTHTANGGGYTVVTAALAVTVTDNDSQAMGAPIIDGLPEVGETLTADTSQIMDADGLSRPGYRYQWVRVASEGVETDIPRATSATYRVIADDVGAALKVEATFTDDKGNPESAESTASAAVTVAQVVATFGSGPYAAEEGRSARVRVSLDKNPHRIVTIPLMAAPRDGADPGDYTVPTEVVFNAGETSKDVTVTAVDDSIDDDGESVELTFGGLPVGVSEGATTLAAVRITDNDGRGIDLSSTSLSITEGGTARTYTVALATQPTATVTVTITGHSGTDVSLDSTVLFFTPSDWNTAQTIMVSAAQDPDGNNDSAALTHTASGADYDSVEALVTVTVVDDDRAQPPVTRGGGGGGFGPAPVAPSFIDGFRTARAVAANARPGDAVGEPVSATHPDELVIAYTLSGTDAASFAVDEETGQIRVKEGVDLTIGRTYTINLTATDSAGFGAIIIVMIEVTEASFSPYDRNGNDSIERDEVIMAVADYFKGSIDKEDVIEVIKLYFAG